MFMYIYFAYSVIGERISGKRMGGVAMTIDEVLAFDDIQIFDRKSVNIEPKALAIPIIAFANADGVTVAIGISDKTRRIE